MEIDKISVIIPAYNAEKTIDRCLESVCNQTYKNLEIIIIDDGSTDSTYGILEAWSQKDSRIKVLTQNNSGGAAARNLGISHITGKYFGFVDADDWVECEIYERLHDVAVDQNCDIVSASIREIYEGDVEEERINSENLPVLSGMEAACYMLKFEGGIRTVVWDKLYYTALIHDIWFETFTYAEDTLFNYCVMMQCNRYGRISYIGYTYDHRESQLTSKPYDSRKLSNVYVGERIEQIFEDSMKRADSNKVSCNKYKILRDAIRQYQVTIDRQVFHSMLLQSDYRGRDKKDYEIIRKAALKIDKTFVRQYLSKSDYLQWKLYLYWPEGFRLIHKIRH